jgi:hypothetical protein
MPATIPNGRRDNNSSNGTATRPRSSDSRLPKRHVHMSITKAPTAAAAHNRLRRRRRRSSATSASVRLTHMARVRCGRTCQLTDGGHRRWWNYHLALTGRHFVHRLVRCSLTSAREYCEQAESNPPHTRPTAQRHTEPFAQCSNFATQSGTARIQSPWTATGISPGPCAISPSDRSQRPRRTRLPDPSNQNAG